MKQEPTVRQVLVDPRRNTLTLILDRPLDDAGTRPAIMEVGAFGRLHGLEIDGSYLTISDPEPDTTFLVREIALAATVSPGGGEVILGRRGPGWEVSFPSGNQCWQVRTGGTSRAICAVTLANAGGPD
jgi:hypothetical protein